MIIKNEESNKLYINNILIIIMTSAKRKLTNYEIEDIIKSLETKKVNKATESVYNNVIDKLIKQMSQVEIYPEMFTDFKNKIIKQFFTSKISPGENVGILIAQSIGEKQTQMSIGYEDSVYIKLNNMIHNVLIGKFIDEYMVKNKDKTVEIWNESWVISTEHENLYVPSIDNKGNISFKKLTMLSKHRPNGNLFQVETKSGQKVLSTGSHSLLTIDDTANNVIPIKAKDVKLNMVMPVMNTWHNVFETTKLDDFISPIMAIILGIYIRVGSIEAGNEFIYLNTVNKRDENYVFKYAKSRNIPYIFNSIIDKELYTFIKNTKSIPLYLISKCNKKIVYNFLKGLFNVKKVNKINQTVNCNNKVMRDDLAFLIKTCLPSIHIGLNQTDKCYTIEMKTAEVANALKNQFYKCWVKTSDSILWTSINNIVEVREKEYKYDYVYDFSVEDNETFLLTNGLFVHNTLNTFHTTGLTVNTVVTGVPRFLELMNTTKEPKSSSCTIRFKQNDTINCITDIRNYIGDSLKAKTINMLMDDYSIVDINDIKNDWWLTNLNEKMVEKVLRIQFSHKKIYENRICMSAIVNKINSSFEDISAISSSVNECILDIFINNKESVKIPKKQISYVNEDNKYEIFFEEIVLKKFEKFIISGIEKINDFMIYTVTPGKEWVVSTEGSNLKGIMECELFDSNSIISNNMWEIYYTLGIEAAREFLINEFINVISSDGTFINKCHVYLLVDFMTFKGDISSISRYSLRNKTSPLARSSFEESIENFLKSGIFTENDNMKSISSNIMTGKLSHTGTGICDLLIDTNIYYDKPVVNNINNVYNMINQWLSKDVDDEVNNTLIMLPSIFET